MTTMEKEFICWLRRQDKTPQETLTFALHAWQSVEFMLNSKYELILQWLIEQSPTEIFSENVIDNNVKLLLDKLEELLTLRTQPGLISQQMKKELIQWFLTLSSSNLRLNLYDPLTSIKWARLLHALIKFEPIQDYFRLDYDLYGSVFGKAFECCDVYIKQCGNEKHDQSTSLHQEVIAFVADILKTLKDILQRTGDVSKFCVSYTKNIVEPLVKLNLQLQNNGYDFWNEFREMEHLLTYELTDKQMIKRLMLFVNREYVYLSCLECAVVNRKGLDIFVNKVLTSIFDRFSNLSNSTEKLNRLWLTIIASLFEILRRRDININFMIKENKAVNYLGEQIYIALQNYRKKCLPEVLRLLCSTLRLNPLILEEYFYEVTVWMILEQKFNPDLIIQQKTNELFAEFLILLISTFRRLSRVEKFVVNLLKELKKQLNFDAICNNNDNFSEFEVDKLYPCKKRKLLEQDTERNEYNNIYLKLLIINLFGKATMESNEVETGSNTCSTSISNAFSELKNFWPSSSVGQAFSQLVTGLMLKPSLVIWKSLLFALKDLLKYFEEKCMPFNENEMLLIDFHVALLCQYFAGFKLTEQYTIDEKNLNDILAQRDFTIEILKRFGLLLLKREHEPRLMCAFLQLTYFTSCFQLMLVYYRADGSENNIKLNELLNLKKMDVNHESNTLENDKENQKVINFDRNFLHDFLTNDEWNLIKQRVLNFGRTNCKYLLQRLYFQQIQAAQLLIDGNNIINENYFTKDSDRRLEYDGELLQITLKREIHLNWLMKYFQRNEKLLIAMHIIEEQKISWANINKNDFELIELIAYNVYDKISHLIENCACKEQWLNRLKCDFSEITEDGSDRVKKKHGNQLMEKLLEFVNNDNENGNHLQNIKKTFDKSRKAYQKEDLKAYLNILSDLPLGLLRCSSKILILVLHLTLYRDIRMMDHNEDLNEILLEIIKDLFHFGSTIPLLKYFSLKQLLLILPPKSTSWDLYEYFITYITNEEKGCENFLKEFVDYLQNEKVGETSNFSLTSEQRHMLLLILKKLSSSSTKKRFQKQYELILNIFSKYIHHHFNDLLAEAESATCKKHQTFVRKTLPGFISYVENIFEKTSLEENSFGTDINNVKTEAEPIKQLNEDFMRLFKVYIGNSMDYRNAYATKLMEIAIKYRTALQFDQAEIELVFSNYWQQINADLNSGNLLINNDQSSQSSLHMALKLILEHKSNEDFLILLKTIYSECKITKELNIILENKYELLALIAKCPLSKIKGAIFNEEYKRLTLDLSIVTLKNALQEKDYNLPLKILKSQLNLLENQTIPLSLDTVDTILGCLMEIKIQVFSVNNQEISISLLEICRQMIEMCYVLIKIRPIFLMDRMPQYTHIIKNLIQSIVWYKCERQIDTKLPDEELNKIAELALKLETLMKTIAEQEQAIAVKRIAPFVLIFVINLIVSNKRPTTLYNKIRLHVEGICYTLIGICDHRVGRFILRSSSEAGRQLYENLLKDYKKYHKYKGKV